MDSLFGNNKEDKEFEENSRKYRILNFYLDCSHWHEQEKEIKKCGLALPVEIVDVEEDEDIVSKYNVNSLPKLILVDYNGKELHRWKGITPSSEINNFLFSNGYAPKRPLKMSSFTGSKRYDANKIISSLKSSYIYDEENLMNKGLAIINENNRLKNNEEVYSIVEALKLFVELNKIVDCKKEESGKTSAWKPKALLYIALCNYMIGNFQHAYSCARKGLIAIDDAINDSYFTGIPRNHYGEKDLLDLIDLIESEHKDEHLRKEEIADVDVNFIDTNKIDLILSVNCEEPNDNNIISKEFITSVVKKYDALRMQLMMSYMGGNQQSINTVIMLHEFMAPVFYAWEYFGYGDMYDFWSEDQALGIFKKFKSSNILAETKRTYNTISNGIFPFRVIDNDGSLKNSTMRILKALIDNLE